MPTVAEASDRIYQKHDDVVSEAEAQIAVAESRLSELAAVAVELPLTLVNTTIGQSVSLTWTNTPTLPTHVDLTEPDINAAVPDLATEVPDTAADVGQSPLADGDAPDPDVTDGDMPYTDWGECMTDSLDTPVAPTSLASAYQIAPCDTIPDEYDWNAEGAGFTFDEPAYQARFIVSDTDQVRDEVSRVLAGDLGLPAEYWENLWAETAGQHGRLLAGRLRRARNSGAASYWPLPSEAVIAPAREMADEAHRLASVEAMKQAQARAVMAREDFWQAVTQAIQWERLWSDAHQQIGARALQAAQQTTSLRVQAHNANVARFNALIAHEQVQLGADEARVRAELENYRNTLAYNDQLLRKEQAEVARFEARVRAWSAEKQVLVSEVAEEVRLWLGKGDLKRQWEELKLRKTGVDVERYRALVERVQTVNASTAALFNARTGAFQADVAGQVALFETDKAQNAAELDKARIDQAAQEAKARIDVAQAQWIGGQSQAVAEAVARLAEHLAASMFSAAAVNLSGSLSQSENYSGSL